MNIHNHNSETYLEEGINMPNGFNNPYITTEGDESFDIDALIQYITDIQGGQGGFGNTWDYDVTTGTSTIPFNVNLPSYGYQGMSPEIMQALGNVFTVGEDGFDPEIFGEDFIMSQILEQIEGMGGYDELLPGAIWSVPEGESPSGVVPGGYFDPSQFNPTIEIGDWDYGDIESALGFTNIFDPESLAATLSQLGGIDPETGDPIRAGEVKALTPEMIEKTTSAYYSPYEEAERETLVEKLGKARGQAQTGGFAGSGGREAGLSGAERLYRGGYEDLLANIMKMRGSSTGDVLDTIYGWQELMSDQ